MSETFDLVVVGAGPAGLAAAVTAAGAGCRVAVVDLGDRVGGQYFRHAEGASGRLHRGWEEFRWLRHRFETHRAAGRLAYFPRHAVWAVERAADGFAVHANAGERDRIPRTVEGRTLLVATGAYDRHVPFPGWTLPGVVAVGGAQALAKGSHAAVGRHVVVAGTGPFLLSAADSLLAVGARVAAVVEASRPVNYLQDPGAILGALPKLREAAHYATRLARHRVPYLTGHAVVAAHGSRAVEAVTVARIDDGWRVVPGTERRLPCDTLAVGFGFVPQLELPLALGCAARLGLDGAPAIVVDSHQRTSVPGVFAAGETTGVGGADLALVEGRLAASAVCALVRGRAAFPDTVVHRLRAKREKLQRFADLLARAHPVKDGWIDRLPADTLVCRCEDVPAGRIAAAVDELGATDVRTVKLLARPGMGWCQGRICGTATAALTASRCGRKPTLDELLTTARRPFAQPVPLHTLATTTAHTSMTGEGS